MLGTIASIAGIASAGASLLGGRKQSKAAGAAAAADAAAAAQMREDLKPYREGGEQGLKGLMGFMGFDDKGNYNPDPLPDYSLDALSDGFKESPGYQYMFDEMMRATQNSAAGRGMLQSGPTLKALQRNAGGLASQEYWQFVNANRQGNYDTENSQQRRVGNLQWLANMGQNSAAQSGQATMSAAQSAGNRMQQGAAAQASGLTGAANALQNFAQNQQFFNNWDGKIT